jgi:hypothetical protein
MARSFWNRLLGRRRFLKESAAAGLLLSLPRGQAEAAPPPNYLYWVKNIPKRPFTCINPNHHVGVNELLKLMGEHYLKFYRSDTVGPLSGPHGLIAANDVVLVKVNAQWKYRGCTNSDVIRGLIQKILDHPDGFSGEVVIIENGQGQGSLNCDGNLDWYPDATQHANANDETHSFQYLVEHIFRDLRVSSFSLDRIRDKIIDENDHTTDGYRILLNVSYPCFTTDGGNRVELQRGIHTDPAGFTQNLKLINVPVLKDHWYTSLTCSLKHTYGILSMADGVPFDRHFGDVGQIWGMMMELIKTPVLNIVDAIWVSQGKGDPPTRQWGLLGYPPEVTTRTNQLLASQDPVALDYWAAKYILYPIDEYEAHHPDRSPQVDAWLTSARDTINGRGGLYDPDKAIYVRDVTKNEAGMAVYIRNMAARRVVPAIGKLLLDE